jgi:hypothetical protein
LATGLPEPGKTTITDRIETIDIDAAELGGGILIKVIAVSIDPYMRLIMREPGNAIDFKGVVRRLLIDPVHSIDVPNRNLGLLERCML